MSGLACLLIEHKGMSIVEAIQTVYASQLYQRLKIESTKTWYLGPAALFQELAEELSFL